MPFKIDRINVGQWMKQAHRARFLKFLRTFHSWIAIIVFPWVLIMGLTGFYLNHSKMILGWFETTSYDESQFGEWPDIEVTRFTALDVAVDIWPDERVQKVEFTDYHDRPSILIEKPSGSVIVSEATGHYFVKTYLTRKTYAPDGTELHSKIYWGSAFKILHTRGWLNSRFGTWLVDITSISLVIFSVSGIFLWWMPRAKKFARFVRRA